MKKINDYDLTIFNKDDPFNRERIVALLNDKVKMNQTQQVYGVVDSFLKVDDSNESYNYLFKILLNNALYAKESIFFNLLTYKFNDKIKDEHCAFVWKKTIESIPGGSNYRYISVVSSFAKDYQYKEFKKSIVETILERQVPNTAILFMLHDKNLLSYKNLPDILSNTHNTITLVEYFDRIKMPQKNSKTITDIFIKIVDRIDDFSKYNVLGNVDKKTIKKLSDFFFQNYKTYENKELNNLLYSCLQNNNSSNYEGDSLKIKNYIMKDYYDYQLEEKKDIPLKGKLKI